mgnify:CR=1 FL=1
MNESYLELEEYCRYCFPTANPQRFAVVKKARGEFAAVWQDAVNITNSFDCINQMANTFQAAPMDAYPSPTIVVDVLIQVITSCSPNQTEKIRLFLDNDVLKTAVLSQSSDTLHRAIRALSCVRTKFTAEVKETIDIVLGEPALRAGVTEADVVQCKNCLGFDHECYLLRALLAVAAQGVFAVTTASLRALDSTWLYHRSPATQQQTVSSLLHAAVADSLATLNAQGRIRIHLTQWLIISLKRERCLNSQLLSTGPTNATCVKAPVAKRSLCVLWGVVSFHCLDPFVRNLTGEGR